LVQEGLARNKRRSGFTREAPRGRRSISQALKISRQTPQNSNAAPSKIQQRRPCKSRTNS
ncbi:hypothetical protein ACF8SB_15485, partial [Pseudomonas sp. CJQ_8]